MSVARLSQDEAGKYWVTIFQKHGETNDKPDQILSLAEAEAVHSAYLRWGKEVGFDLGTPHVNHDGSCYLEEE